MDNANGHREVVRLRSHERIPPPSFEAVMEDCHVIVDDGACDPHMPLSSTVLTIINELVDEYDRLHVAKIITGRGLGLEKAEGTTRKYREHAKRVLQFIADTTSTSETRLKQQVRDADMDAVIATCCLTPTSGATRVQYLVRLQCLLDFIDVTSSDDYETVGEALRDARHLARQQTNINDAARAFSAVGDLFTQGAGDAAGTMGANPNGDANIIPTPSIDAPELMARLSVQATVHQQLLADLEAP